MASGNKTIFWTHTLKERALAWSVYLNFGIRNEDQQKTKNFAITVRKVSEMCVKNLNSSDRFRL
jgi:hypothetical protein